MFVQKNTGSDDSQKTYGSTDPQNKKSINDTPMNLNEEDFNINDVEVHTMKSDLAELKNPQQQKINIKLEDNERPEMKLEAKAGPFFQNETQKTPVRTEIFNSKDTLEKKPLSYFNSNKTNKQMENLPTQEKPKASFAPAGEIKEEKNTTTSTEGIFNPTPEMNNQEITSSESDSDSGSHGIGKAIVIAIMVTVIIIVGVGGYYFWMTRVSTKPQTPQENIATNETPSETTPAVEEVLPELSDQNSNYLVLDTTGTENKRINEILVEYSKKVWEIKKIGVFEFLVTDKNNTPIKFEDFASMAGLAIPSDILTQLGPDFKLYIYNYGDKTRLGLSIAIKDSAQAKTALLKKESDLVQAFSTLYSSANYTKPITSFAEATYGKTPAVSIRYINITDSEDMSLDYAIFSNQLIIGTTKTATFSIIDRLTQKNTIPAK